MQIFRLSVAFSRKIFDGIKGYLLFLNLKLVFEQVLGSGKKRFARLKLLFGNMKLFSEEKVFFKK